MLEYWKNLIDQLKQRSRAPYIWAWHEETLGKMNCLLFELRRRNNWKKI